MRIFSTLCCAALALCAHAQAPFARSYLLSRPTHINGSTLTPDGGLLLCGYASDGADSLRMGRGFLMRTDASGDLLWVREHDGGFIPEEFWTEPFTNIAYNDIHLNPDSTYLLVGVAFESFMAAGEFLAMGIDAFGDTLWTTVPSGMTPTDTYDNIAPANSGQAFVSGYSSTGINEYVHLEKFDVQTGHRSIESRLSLNNFGGATSLRAALGSGCVSAGWTSDPGVELWVRLSDNDLNTVWQTTFGLALLGNAKSIVAEQAPGGDVWGAVAHSHYNLPTKPLELVHFSAGGAIISSTTYALPGTPVPVDMRIKPNGKLLVAGTGYLDTYLDTSYAFLMQIDPDGTVDWAWRYDGEPGDSVKVVSMELLPGSGDVYLIGSARTGRPLVIRTDSLGMVGACTQQSISAISASSTWNTGTLLAQPWLGVPTAFTETFVPLDSTLYSIVLEQCGAYQQLYRATGNVYYDVDGNGGLDPGEVGLAWYPISIAPATGLAYTNSSGDYELITDIADTYTITPSLPQQWWAITSDSATYHPAFTPADTLFTDLDFGYDPALDTTILEGSLGGWVSCNFPFYQQLRVRNLGTTTPQGIAAYTYDTSMQLLNTIPPFDSLVGQTIYWHFDSLWFGSLAEFDMEFQLIPFTWADGDTLTTELTVHADDGLGNLSVADQEQVNRVITCSFDPNNKAVAQPAFIPVDQVWIEYTVNFQNTGTDTAYSVVIEDQLSPHLQWGTLQYLGSSHNLTALNIGALGKAEFSFNNILLPDSNVNEPASHGFVTYRVTPQPALPHLSSIENNAGIFFDLNAPVITNTVNNRVVNCSAPGWAAGIVSFAADELWVGAIPYNDTMSYSIQWFLNGAPLSGAIGVVYTSPVSGTYTASMTDEFGCAQVSAPFEVINVAVAEADEAQLRAFPDPFNDATVLLSRTVLDADATILVIDLHGRVVRTMHGSGTHELLIERGDLRSGLYTVRVLDDAGKRAAVRIVVE
ncbi:MAG: T9SS type A sorting domain-containing protein [Flavobacteriales bacterium]